MPHKDTEARRSSSREYKRRNKDRRAVMNADGDRKRHANRRAARYGAPGILTLEDVRYALRERRCFSCGAENPEWLGIDHGVPLSAGGPNTRENIVACCHSCTASKWRADLPWRWSQRYDACQECGTVERQHTAQGLCQRCWYRAYEPTYAARRAARREERVAERARLGSVDSR